ncbi:MAG: DUF370 domain-containing protein [Ruminococcaceae bacterium]|nr:DUF370 domain-containing protein [Oscillospiraceae bacterium]
MYIHLGQNVVVEESTIIGIFDMDNTTESKITINFLNNAEKSGRIVNISEDIPKSFVVCQKKDKVTIYLSQLNPATLLKRAKNPLAFMNE